jgi:enterochelin esterase family protein
VNPADAVVSPQIHADRSVTFRLLAPKAGQALVRGSWMTKPEAMTRDDAGLWTLTAAPVPVGVHSYSFLVDGLQILDPRNPDVKTGSRGAGSSQLYIRGDALPVWEPRPGAHGAVHLHWYESAALGGIRRFHVYTPPGYETSAGATYPVLYLLHGSGDTDAQWVLTARANVILDNQIAAGRTKPMIVVMPFGHAVPAESPRSPDRTSRNTALFEKDLLGGVMPLAEKLYRVSARREDRAVAGLSMGGGQALHVGLANLDRFSHIGVFSMGIRNDSFEKVHAGVLENPSATNAKLKLFWIACGERDSLLPGAEKLSAILNQRQVRHTFKKTAGAHVWDVWVNYLAEFAPQLFR